MTAAVSAVHAIPTGLCLEWNSETSTTIRGHFLAENPTADDWQVTFTLEFLDKSGKIIDRVTR